MLHIMNRSLQHLALGAGLLAVPAALHAQHGHLDAGAAGQNQGDALMFVNGADFAAGSGYVKELTFSGSGTYAGYYQGAITLTAVHALAGTDASGVPYVAHPQAAAPGAFLQYAIVSVEGPSGGSFQYWEEGAAAPTFSYSSGYLAGTTPNLIALSDTSLGAGTPGGDPYGHLHGRRFSTTTSGEYTVGFQVVDTSANGVGGGPIQGPSDVLLIRFSSVPEPQTLALGLLGLGVLSLAVRRRRA